MNTQVHTENDRPAEDGGLHWYAVRAFKGRVFKIKEEVEAAGFKTYMAIRVTDSMEGGHLRYRNVQIIPHLLFVCCPLVWLKRFKNLHFGDIYVYSDKPGGSPAPIRECEMKLFMFITSTNGGRDVEYFGDTMPEFSEGERVRVVDGIYKGATGFVKRIKKDRKLLVAVEGIAVVAISHIPMSYLQKIDCAQQA